MKQLCVFLLFLGVSFQVNAEENKTERYKDIKIFADRFVNKYINLQYILSENKLVEAIEKEFFDDDTTISPPGDQDTGIKINVVKSFRIDSISDEGDFFAVDVFFLVDSECKVINENIKCVPFNKEKDVRFGVSRVNRKLKIRFVYSQIFTTKEQLLSYAKRMKYKVEPRKN
ncbi:hypothetical protein [Leptospira santarosai]|uniref:DUF4468 domain-containing protein n=1 Tax=Leptospira santarosai TaxID=28183 RepID=A0AB73NCB3_9LEPT|nr:hypothetical protein [Leptospira santarosai]ONF77629.1 hypothetical protein BWD12_14685 [Leptospira santarosai serovar Bananal]ONF83047.1 hypothetical protein BWD13_19390 [Leptospira santarosai serovar Grippotyphosa]ASV11348.1 hypothetical protein B2G51_05775 [Leptospira santarosai]AVV51419.1 Uncharacterized protein XB17_02842 [Leptospira santarosai]AVV77814.1 Uncharacterized protein XB15_00008 [Leptospira santarosai]